MSVDWKGRLYDCDFNQALDLPILDESGKALKIDSFDPDSLVGKNICCEEHCLGCMAGEGSSCTGALV